MTCIACVHTSGSGYGRQQKFDKIGTKQQKTFEHIFTWGLSLVFLFSWMKFGWFYLYAKYTDELKRNSHEYNIGETHMKCYEFRQTNPFFIGKQHTKIHTLTHSCDKMINEGHTLYVYSLLWVIFIQINLK